MQPLMTIVIMKGFQDGFQVHGVVEAELELAVDGHFIIILKGVMMQVRADP